MTSEAQHRTEESPQGGEGRHEHHHQRHHVKPGDENEGFFVVLYREGHLLGQLRWVDFDFGCSILCLVLLRLMGNWQNWLTSWAQWWNIIAQSQPNPSICADGPPYINWIIWLLLNLIVSALFERIKWTVMDVKLQLIVTVHVVILKTALHNATISHRH